MMTTESGTRAISSVEQKSLTAAPAMGQFLRLHLVEETISLLPAEQVTQVLTVATELVVPMPHMAEWIMGAYNHRGEILLLVDLGNLLGLKAISQQARSVADYTVIVVQVGPENAANRLLGLVVDQVKRTEQCDLSSIKGATADPNSDLEELLQGYCSPSTTEVLPVLDLELVWQKIVDEPLSG